MPLAIKSIYKIIDLNKKNCVNNKTNSILITLGALNELRK